MFRYLPGCGSSILNDLVNPLESLLADFLWYNEMNTMMDMISKTITVGNQI